MTKKINILVLALCSLFFIQGQAQSSALSIGVRGGGAAWLSPTTADATTEIKNHIGGNGLVEFRYAYIANVSASFEMGLQVGLGAGFGMASFSGTEQRQFVNTDYLGNAIGYSTVAEYTHKEQFMQTEVSLLLALRASGFVANIGPKLMLPLMVSGRTTIPHADIDAYYKQYNVHVVNQLITGKLESPAVNEGQIGLPAYNLLMAVEAGWEWYVSDNRLGLQTYADISVWSPSASSSANPLLSVAPITDRVDPAAVVTTNSAAGVFRSGRLVEFGVRCYYAFSVGRKRYMKRYQPARDSYEHRNRYWWW